MIVWEEQLGLKPELRICQHFFSPSVAARLHAVDVRTHSAIANAPCILGVFLTVFAVFPLEPIAHTLVVIYFVHWQTLAVVLTGPVSTGCLKKNMYYGSRF